jgi:Flp pilus assembly protein TadB
LPVVVAVFSALTRPEYFRIFYTTVPGVIMLVMGILMMTAGYLWARSIVKVEV